MQDITIIKMLNFVEPIKQSVDISWAWVIIVTISLSGVKHILNGYYIDMSTKIN